MATRFDWDDAKAAANLRKHGIPFSLATKVFSDPFVLLEQDRIEDYEERWQAIGVVEGRRLLVVAYATWDESNGVEVVRIISARKADARDRGRYDG